MRDIVSYSRGVSIMKSSTRARTAGWILAVLVMTSLVSASETKILKQGAGSTAALKDGRADEMFAWSVDSGGGESSGGDFSLTAAIGQPDAGVVARGGTAFEGGVWAGAVDLGFIFGDGFESSGTGVWSSAVGGNP